MVLLLLLRYQESENFEGEHRKSQEGHLSFNDRELSEWNGKTDAMRSWVMKKLRINPPQAEIPAQWLSPFAQLNEIGLSI